MLTDGIVFFLFSFDNEMILLVIKIQVERVQSLENTHFVKITYSLLETSRVITKKNKAALIPWNGLTVDMISHSQRSEEEQAPN